MDSAGQAEWSTSTVSTEQLTMIDDLYHTHTEELSCAGHKRSRAAPVQWLSSVIPNISDRCHHHTIQSKEINRPTQGQRRCWCLVYFLNISSTNTVGVRSLYCKRYQQFIIKRLRFNVFMGSEAISKFSIITRTSMQTYIQVLNNTEGWMPMHSKGQNRKLF